MGIDESYNYSLEGKAALSESTPNAFLMDEGNRVVMVTGYSYVSLINKIIELGGNKEIHTGIAELVLQKSITVESLSLPGVILFLSWLWADSN